MTIFAVYQLEILQINNSITALYSQLSARDELACGFLEYVGFQLAT